MKKELTPYEYFMKEWNKEKPRFIVYQRSDYMWAMKRAGGPIQQREVFRTQREAVETARWKLMNMGGGTLTLEAAIDPMKKLKDEIAELKEEIKDLKNNERN